jgi:hypothetical protein
MVNILKYLKPKSKLINYKMGKPLSPNLLELRNFSDKGKVWENHKVNGETVSTHYADSQFQDYSRRIATCGDSLEFEIIDEELKLKKHGFVECGIVRFVNGGDRQI